MLVWAVLALATSLTPLKSFLLDVQSPFYAAAVVGTIFGGVRFARNKSIQRHLLTLIASLALVFPAWFLTRIVASALFAMLGTIAMGIVTRSASGSLYGLTQAWDAATKYVSFELSLLWGNLLYAIPAMLVFAAAGQIRRMLTSQDWA